MYNYLFMKKNRTRLSYFLLSLLVALTVFLSPFTASKASAQGVMCIISDFASVFEPLIPWPWVRDLLTGDPQPWYSPTICEFQNKVFNTPEEEIFGERYTYAQVGWIVNSLAIHTFPALWGANIIDSPINFLINLLSQKTTPQFSDFAKLGLPGLIAGSVSEFYTHPPASGYQAVSQSLAKFSLIPPAHAQGGYGYSSLDAVRSLWTASRNTSYLLMTLLLVAAGFLIIFRVKINPQTIVTLQIMIPKIIITFVLITFSYAIGGFIIDLVYVAVSFAISAIATQIPGIQPLMRIAFYTGPSLAIIFLLYIAFLGVFNLLPLGPIIYLVLVVVVMFLFFKIWWLLFRTYLTLMAQIIFAPWMLMLGLLPGNAGFGNWFRGIIANASVFAVVPLMFFISLLIWSPFNILISALNQIPFLFDVITAFLTPLGIDFAAFLASLGVTTVGDLPSLPLFNGNGFFFTTVIGYAIVALIPKSADMIRDAIKAPQFKYGSAFGEALSQPYGIYQGAVANQQARAKLTGDKETFLAQGLSHEISKRTKFTGGSGGPGTSQPTI